MDIKLKGNMDGIGASKEIKKLNIPVIFSTANSDVSTHLKEISLGSNSLFIKTFNVVELSKIIKSIDGD